MILETIVSLGTRRRETGSLAGIKSDRLNRALDLEETFIQLTFIGPSERISECLERCRELH